MTSKPIVTCSGHEQWSQKIQSFCFLTLASEPYEWVRAKDLGSKISREVHVDVTFQRFEVHALPFQTMDAIDKPVAHLFVTVNDMDHFKKHANQPFANWLKALQDRGIEDWLVVLVNEEPTKMRHRILKQTVADILRSSYNVKQVEKHTFTLDESSATRNDSWMQFLNVLRRVVLNSYDRILTSYEERICRVREERYEATWNYFSLFALQEDLACIYESLCLYEDALTQYDELESIFVKCVDAHRAGERQKWLITFCQLPCAQLCSVFLTNYLDYQRRRQVHSRCVCLLDFRAYLLSRQSCLLLMLSRQEEVPARAHSAILSALHEAKYLRMSSEPGLLHCWIYLGCMQVIQSCERFCNPLGPGRTHPTESGGHRLSHPSVSSNAVLTGSSRVEEVIDLMPRTMSSALVDLDPPHASTPTRTNEVNSVAGSVKISQGEAIAELHRLAFVHLRALGVLCRLWPQKKTKSSSAVEPPTSAEALRFSKAIQSVNQLLLSDSADDNGQQSLPDDNSAEGRLRKCLLSVRYYQEVFVETALLCIGILKHNNRIRMAHLISLDLANFYCLMGESERAERLYSEALHVYRSERWNALEFHIYQKLAHCQKTILDKPQKYVRTCLHLSSSFSLNPATPSFELCLSPKLREHYWGEIQSTISTSAGSGTFQLLHPAQPLLQVESLRMHLPCHSVPITAQELRRPLESGGKWFGFHVTLRSWTPLPAKCKVEIRANRLHDDFDPTAAAMTEREIADCRRHSSLVVEFNPLARLYHSHQQDALLRRTSSNGGGVISTEERSATKRILACDRVFSSLTDAGEDVLEPGLNSYWLLGKADGLYWPEQLVVSLFSGAVSLVQSGLGHHLVPPSVEDLQCCLPCITLPDSSTTRVRHIHETLEVLVKPGLLSFPAPPGSNEPMPSVALTGEGDPEKMLSRVQLTPQPVTDGTGTEFRASLDLVGDNSREKLRVKVERWCSVSVLMTFHSLFHYQLTTTVHKASNSLFFQVRLLVALPLCETAVQLSTATLTCRDCKEMQPTNLSPLEMMPSFVTVNCPLILLWRLERGALHRGLASLGSQAPNLVTLTFSTHLASCPWRPHDKDNSGTGPLIHNFTVPVADL